MINVASVEFSPVGRIYDFRADDHVLIIGDQVVVETERGLSLATVVKVRFESEERFKDRKLRPIMRKASEKDIFNAKNLSPEHAVKITTEKVKALKLNMKVLKADIQFGGSKVVIYFSAPGRVDFRELVKQLASALRSRVELKQVGARDEAKLLGGIGVCGREYCCSTFLREFVPVSIKMAKTQNLALNPTKVSGGCGRLLCCLTYENNTYEELRKSLPTRGSQVRLLEHDHQVGVIIKVDYLSEKLDVEVESGKVIAVAAKDVQVVRSNKNEPEAEDESLQEDWGQDLDLSNLD